MSTDEELTKEPFVKGSKQPAYAVLTMLVEVIPDPDPDELDIYGNPVRPAEEIIVSVPNQPVDSVLVADNVDLDARTGEGLLVCWGSTAGEKLEDRDAAVAKFEELKGRPPEQGELP